MLYTAAECLERAFQSDSAREFHQRRHTFGGEGEIRDLVARKLWGNARSWPGSWYNPKILTLHSLPKTQFVIPQKNPTVDNFGARFLDGLLEKAIELEHP